jgi:phospholipid/cholesterol/gamma-HCH transport system substrate-binding protein
MKIANEVKIGFFAVLTVLVSIWGYNFLKGVNVLGKSFILYTELEDARQLNSSAPVFYKGVEIGTVTELILDPETNSKAVVKMKLNYKLPIPKNAVATLFPNGFLGGMAMRLDFANPCKAGDCLEYGGKIQSRTETLVQNAVGAPDSLKPYFRALSSGASMLMDSISNGFSDPNNELNKTFKSIQATVDNLKGTTAALNKLIAASSTSIGGTMQNLEAVTANLKASNEQIRSILGNTEAFTGNLKAIDLSKTTNGANDAMASLKKTLETSERTVGELNNILARVKSGEGSLGKLMADDSLYQSLSVTILHSQLLLQDLRLNPRRYVNLNIFKKYKPYVKPEEDPAFPKGTNGLKN